MGIVLRRVGLGADQKFARGLAGEKARERNDSYIRR
jgi:hypothetical protein